MRALVVALLLALCPALASAQALPTGSAYIASTGGSCAGSIPQASCRLASVVCNNLWDPIAKRVFSSDELTASLKVSNPVGTPIGLVLFLMGGGSTAGYESATYGASVVQAALDAGYRTVQISWANNSGPGAWLGSPSSSSYGGDGYPDGALYAGACRAATLFKAIYESDLMPTGGVYLATGQSGGSAQLTYALTRYGAGDWFDGVLLTGGPSIGVLREGCEGSRSAWWQTQCATWRVTVGSACQYGDAEVGGQFIDLLWNDGRRNCALGQGFIPSHFSQSYGYQSALGGSAQRRFAYTTIRQLIGDADGSEAVPMGRYLTNQLVDRSGSAVSAVITTGSVPHLVPDTVGGASAVSAMLVGGTYNGVTYSAMTRTRPSASSSTWTPESLPGVELWMHTHATAHLWVEPHTSQGLTHPTNDGDVVRGIDEPTQGHHMLPGTVELGSTAASNSHLVLNRAESDYVQVLNSGTAFDFIHNTGIFFFGAHLGVASDGTLMNIADSAGASTLNRGLFVTKTAANRVRFAVTRGSSGTYVYDCTSAASLTANMGVVPIWFAAGGSAGARFRVGSAAVETCARSNAPNGTGSAAQILWIGRTSAGGNAFDGRIQDVVIASKLPSDADITAFEAWNPARTSTSLVRWVGRDAGYYNFLVRDYDFTGVHSAIYSDTTATTPITAGGAIALVRSSNDPDGSLGRDLTQSTAANRPTWISGGLTGQGADYDGVNDELTFTQSISRGAHTWLVVGSNRDATNGSHFVAGAGASRILAVGPGYSGVATPVPPGHAAGQVYMTTHASAGSTCGSDLPQQGQTSTDFNVLVHRRDGSTFTNEAVANGAAVNQCSVTNTDTFVVTSIGRSGGGITNWELDGRMRRVMQWGVALTDAQLARIYADLCARWPEAC